MVPSQTSDARRLTNRSARTRRRRWLRRCVAVVLLTALLPSAVTLTGTWLWLVRQLHPSLGRVLQAERITVHWWEPIDCRQITVQHTRSWAAQAPPLLTVRRIRSTVPLWQIALRAGRGIELTITEPTLTVAQADGRTGLVDALDDLSGGRSGSSWPLRLRIRDGLVQAARPGDPAESEPVAATRSERASSGPKWDTEVLLSDIQCDLSTEDEHRPLPRLRLTAAAGHTLGNESDSLARSRRTTLNPRVAARLRDLTADFPSLALEPSPDSDSTDRALIQVYSGPTPRKRNRHTLQVQIGNIELRTLEPLVRLMIPDFRCRGRCSARISAVMAGRTPEDGIALTAAVRMADVTWRQAGWHPAEAVRLETLDADAAVALAEDGILVQSLSLESPIARLSGGGELPLPVHSALSSVLSGDRSVQELRRPNQDGAAAAGIVRVRGEVDLVRLTNMLPRTFRLRHSLKLTDGTLRFSAEAGPADDSADSQTDGRVPWMVRAETSSLAADRQGRRVTWEAPVRADASGFLTPASFSLNRFGFRGDFGELSVVRQGDRQFVRARLDPGRLWNRLRQFVNLASPGIHGPLRMQAQVNRTDDGAVVLRSLQLKADRLQVESERLRIRNGASAMQMFDGQLSVQGTGRAIRSLLAPWADLTVLDPDTQVNVDLSARSSSRLTVVAEVRPGERPTNRQTSGSAVQQARLAVDIDTLSDPGEYTVRSGRLEIPGLNVDVQGTLKTIAGVISTQLTADARYDLETLTPILTSRPSVPIRLTGTRRSRLVIQGPPAYWNRPSPDELPPFVIQGDFGWDTAQVLGVELSAATVPFVFTEGRLQTEAIRCSVGDGRFHAMINYDTGRGELSLATGSGVDNLALTPQLCRTWLSWVTPFLADAARVDGRVSARAKRFQYLTGRPQDSLISATVDLDRTVATPGPSVAPLLEALRILKPERAPGRSAWELIVPEQKVSLLLQHGRLQHDAFLLEAAGYRLRTRGTVGLDRRIDLVLDIPLKRTESARIVSVPLTGTVTRPMIDPSQLLLKTGRSRLEDEIGRQLDRGLNDLIDRIR